MMSEKQQLFLLELLWCYCHKENGIRKEIIKKPLFSNDADFFKQIKELIDFGYIKKVNYESNKISYQLTEDAELTGNGWALANIIAKQLNTDAKFRKIAKSIIWMPSD